MENVERVRAAQGGDREAFGILVGEYHAYIYRLCYRMLGSAADAEDLTQETFVEAYLKLGQLRDAERFGGWLRTLALNLCRMRWRGGGPDTAELPEEIAAPEGCDAGQAGARVAYGLSRLSPAHRMALVLHYLEGLSYEEVAQFLGVPIGTVMSRLHRGRRALKEMLEKMREDEEVPMIPDEECRREVDAEIRVLLGIFREQPEAMERLSTLLRHSPERLVQWMRESEDAQVIDDLALLLPRLGSTVIDALLACVASPEAGVRERAVEVLRRSLAWCRPGWPGTADAGRKLAPRHAYVVADRVIGSALEPAARARLFLDLMPMSDAQPTAALFANLLLCETEAAFLPAMERFRAAGSPQGIHQSPNLLYALCRFGPPFCDELTRMLGSGDSDTQALALVGVEGVRRCLDHDWLEDPSSTQFCYEVRTRLKWPPLRTEDVGGDAVDAMAQATAALLGHPEAALRDAAIRVLGGLKVDAYAPQVRECLRHPEVSTRLAALVALSEIGDAESAPRFLEMARGGSAPERRAAVEALGRLGFAEAQPLLAELVRDADPQVRRSAVIALGEVGGDEAQAVLRQILHGPDRALAKAAVGALHGGRKPASAGPSERLRRRLMGEDDPGRPFTLASIEAALLFALPALQPYDERDLTRRIAAVCSDYSGTRRYLVDEGLMRREGGIYTFTPLGETLWHVEHHILERYLERR